MKLAGSIFFAMMTWTFMSFASPTINEGDSNCQRTVERRGSIQVQRISSRDNTVCYISIRNFKETSLYYRNYLFTSDGELMVFNSLGPGNESETTGAREFFMFPRHSPLPTFEWSDEQRRLIVTTLSGNKAYFDYENAELVEMSQAQVKVASEISPNNKGGVEILNYQGLLLDSGFKLGSAPTQNFRAYSKFTDKNGRSCKVQNNEVFKKTEDQDVYFRFSDEKLRTFLKKRCPQLLF